MDLMSFYSSDLFKWVILPILIFLARLTDVSLGTMRIIFVSRGVKYLAPVIGFVEINIWLLAIGQIMENLSNNNPNSIVCTLAYAGGFATGSFVGILIEEKVSIGLVLLRLISRHDTKELIEYLKSENYGVTIHDAEGVKGPVKIIFAVIRRKDLHSVLDRINQIHPHAFYSVEDVRSVGEAVMPMHRRHLFSFQRKGK
jgi:uncharacterized protein YebE (UPF0316 family)